MICTDKTGTIMPLLKYRPRKMFQQVLIHTSLISTSATSLRVEVWLFPAG